MAGSPWDKRLDRVISFEQSAGDSYIVSPMSDIKAYATTGIVPDKYSVRNDEKVKDVPDRIRDKIKRDDNTPWAVTNSIMNSYTMTRLYGAHGGKYLIDSSKSRKYYEVNGTGDKGGYAKNPTTAAIINWGNGDEWSRTPYQYQDFVFCKYWNKIPNNRMITLRRFPNPILDNMNYPTMSSNSDDSKANVKTRMHPLATAVTYFGGGTDNKLSDILSFTTGLEWDEIQSDIWDVTGQTEGMEETLHMFGQNNWISQHARSIVDVMGIFNPDEFNANEANGLPPDPYSNGPYENRVIGPVNVINKVMKRKRGLKFSMDGLTLRFHYVARPVGGINAKAALLDILGNIMTMCSASAQFFGGAHRFMLEPNRYPFNNSDFFSKMYKGQLLTTYSADGKTRTPGAAETLVDIFSNRLAGKSSQDYKIGDVGKQLLSGLGSVLKDAATWLSTAVSSIFSSGNPFKGLDLDNMTLTEITRRMQPVLGNEMRHNVGTVPYLTGMRALFTGEPIGDWHLTIGNPMNPIAMIGNLICDSLKIDFDDELGPDDFPIGFTATITLKHGMPPDRDAIESMFNRGAGRIYEISDDMSSSADKQTKVDDQTQDTSKKPDLIGPVITGQGRNGRSMGEIRLKPGYESTGSTLKFTNSSAQNDLDTISDLAAASSTGVGLSSHVLAPWAIKNIM